MAEFDIINLKELNNLNIPLSEKKLIKLHEEILEYFAEYTNSFNLDDTYILIISKLAYSLNDASHLWNKNGFGYEIIIRSCFEDIVLLEYLIQYPKEIKIYRLDSNIVARRNLYGAYKLGLIKKEDFIHVYESSNEEIKKIIKLEDKNEDLKVNSKFENWYPLSQQTRRMLKKLETKSALYSKLNVAKWEYYNLFSQKTHSFQHTTIELHREYSKEEILIKVKDRVLTNLDIIAIAIKMLPEPKSSNKEMHKQLVEKIHSTHSLIKNIQVLGYN